MRIARSRFSILVALAALCLAACTDLGGVRDEERFSHLSERDKEWLKLHESDPYGFAFYVTDEMYFRVNSYNYSLEFFEIQVMNPQTTTVYRFNILDLAADMDEGAIPTAEKLLEKAQKKIGPPPPPPRDAAPLIYPLSPEHDKAQRLRYPEMWRSNMRRKLNKPLTNAQKRMEEGNVEAARTIFRDIINEQLLELREDDPFIIELCNRYMSLTGDVVTFQPGTWGSEIKSYSKEEAASLGITHDPRLDPNATFGPDGKMTSNVADAGATAPAPANPDPAAAAPAGLPGLPAIAAPAAAMPPQPAPAAAPITSGAPAAAAPASATAAAPDPRHQQVDDLLRSASEAWNRQDYAGAIRLAESAKQIAVESVGPLDPRVMQIDQMIAKAKSASGQ